MRDITDVSEKACIEALENYLNEKATEKKSGKTVEHSRRVREICEKITNGIKENGKMELEICTDKLYRAALLHDIAKYDDKDKHHEKAKKVLEAIGYYNSDICAIIKTHKGEPFDPIDQIAVEAAILRMADKIDKINKGKSEEEVDEKFEQNHDLIESYFNKKRKDDQFEILETVIRDVYKNVKDKCNCD